MEIVNKNRKKEQEWSCYVAAGDIEGKAVRISISAPEDRYHALCNRLNLFSIDAFDVDLVLKRNTVNKVIHVSGKIKADVEQKCIVTMKPVAEHVEEEFEAWFAEPSNTVSFAKEKRERMKAPDKDEQPMLEECEDPEEIVDGNIDVGELAVQYLSLALNPYPRSEGAAYENQVEELEEDEDMYKNPFAVLKDWKMKEKKKD